MAHELPQQQQMSIATSIPGLHIIANLKSDRLDLITSYNEFGLFIRSIIKKYKLNQLGDVYHNFPSGGFTAVVCLSESHLSVHTWPETGYITFDVFLSNYKNDNRGITDDIYREVCAFFQATIIDEHFLNR